MISITMQLAYSLLAIAAITHGSPTPRDSQAITSKNLAIRKSPDRLESANWAGMVVGPTDTSFFSVKGSFLAPTPKLPAGTPKTAEGIWGGAAWVGIDGVAKDEGGLFQAGINWQVSNTAAGTLNTVWQAWYEWYPAPMVSFVAFEISSGDIITVQCTADNSTYGICSVENESTGKKVSSGLKSPSSDAHLLGHHVDWIVEDFEAGFSEIAFADFGTVEWFDCEAGVRAAGDVNGNLPDTGHVYPSDGEEWVLLNIAGKPLTNTTATLARMTVNYIG